MHYRRIAGGWGGKGPLGPPGPTLTWAGGHRAGCPASWQNNSEPLCVIFICAFMNTLTERSSKGYFLILALNGLDIVPTVAMHGFPQISHFLVLGFCFQMADADCEHSELCHLANVLGSPACFFLIGSLWDGYKKLCFFSSFSCTARTKRWAAEEFWMNVSVLRIEPVRMVKVHGDECRLHGFEDFWILLKEIITYEFGGSHLWIWFSLGLSLFNVGLLEGLPGGVFCAIKK